MKCIIVDDEPIAREGIRLLISEIPQLALLKGFNNAGDASLFIEGYRTKRRHINQ